MECYTFYTFTQYIVIEKNSIVFFCRNFTTCKKKTLKNKNFHTLLQLSKYFYCNIFTVFFSRNDMIYSVEKM